LTILLRNAGPGDAPALAELGSRSFKETFGHRYTPDNLAAFLNNHREEQWRSELADPACSVCIGEVDGQAVAYAKLTPPGLPFEPQGRPIELKQFYVLKDWQGSGAAQQLMDWVLDEARRRGAEELYLSVFTENQRAQRFYARYGFEEVGRWAFMVGTHADEDIIMRRAL
jgi:ribosomal protein S18 acetylase RimI-like enzyme